jgi:hypothetical protein
MTKELKQQVVQFLLFLDENPATLFVLYSLIAGRITDNAAFVVESVFVV